jgi:superfamily II DNA or RNA helicase
MNDPIDLSPGLYEHVITDALEQALEGRDDAKLRALNPVDADEALTQHVAKLVRRAIVQAGEAKGTDAEKLARQIEMTNALLQVLRERSDVEEGDLVAATAEELLAIPESGPAHRIPERPFAPLRSSALLVNGKREPSIGQELPLEIASADEILLLCAFLKWSGVRIVLDALREFTARGGRLRVITTTYCAATEVRALEALQEIGAEIKVSYETQATRLHAKAWLFERVSGLSTAYIGSSNLSYSALVDGLEWNVRLAQAETPAMLDRFRIAFNTLWEDEHVSSYDKDEFKEALAAATDRPQAGDAPALMLDINPYPFQRAILEKLDAERHRHDRWQNLVVAATGTGKTIIAALDYQRLRTQLGGDASLLFVAHRGEILRQSQHVFQNATRLPAFGEMYVGGERPDKWRHVFASVQSLKNVDLNELPPGHFDVVIIDEFHHAAASTYERILEHFKPKVLLGLTATPERADGKDILRWFGGRMAAEIRLWEALDKSLLAPFHYFGINDGTDLSAVKWRSSGYDTGELEKLYTADDARVVRVLQQVQRLVADPLEMKALGFCVSVEHARFMARRFTERGIPSVSVDGSTPREERDQALSSLLLGEINCIFSVDVFNEGVDLPVVDTILMLRPTESATIFLQQLGRGLRRSEGKSVCTVLDFIGNQRKEFRFAPRYSGMLGLSRKQLVEGLESGFETLPAGTHFELDRVARESVLANIKASVGSRISDLVLDLMPLGADATLESYLDETGRELVDLYRGSRPGWHGLRRLASIEDVPESPDEERLVKAIGRMLHIDDAERVAFYRELLAQTVPPDLGKLNARQQRLVAMLHLGLWGDDPARAVDVEDGFRRLWSTAAAHWDIRSILDYLGVASDRLTATCVELPASVPLSVHGVYSRSDVLAAIGRSTPAAPYRFREGPLHMPDLKSDFFFVTLNKSEKRFSPSTQYRDYAISRMLFHWETQSVQSPGTPTVQRYLNHRANGDNVFLLVRESTTTDAGMTAPFQFLGAVDYVEHRGSKPVGITWKLRTPMPESTIRASNAAVG